MYDLSALTVFVSVMRHGSLSASARELGLPKSTLSRRLQQLEGKIGQPLLRRDANRMIPTEAGLVFDGYCRNILELAEESRESLDELKEEVSGELTLHAHEALSRGWFAGEVERFLERHPGVRVRLQTQVSEPDPREKDLLCVWVGPVPADLGLRRETLGRLTRGLYAHPDYLERRGAPAHPRELVYHHWVDLLGDSHDGLTLHHESQGSFPLVLPPSRMEVDRMVLQGDALTRGHGLGLLPHWIVEMRSRHHPGTLVSCLPEWYAPALPVQLLYPHGHLARRSRAFIEHVRAAVPQAWKCQSSAGGETSEEALALVSDAR